MAATFPFRNLVFEGGGVKGVAYLGALEVLEKRGILGQIKRVAGASVGGLNALLLSLGYSPAETRKILWKLDFRNFLDDDWGLVRDTRRFVRSFGWYKGDFFRHWVGELIRAKVGASDATFRDLSEHGCLDLSLVVTNLATGFSEICSLEHTPNMPVADAMRMTISIPLFFTAVPGKGHDLYVDGGLLRNYPVKLFDREKYLPEDCRERHSFATEYYASDNAGRRPGSSAYVYNKETLGFRLDAREKINVFRDAGRPRRRKINDLFDYVSSVVNTVLDVQQTVHLHSDDWQRTIYIDSLGVGTLDFKLKAAQKASLVEQGRLGVQHYLHWYEKARGHERPCNHPAYEAPPVAASPDESAGD
ncbi:MAG: patatin-like phospholipase family protein [Gammaproteobacteria bacterium]|jgi:NTE family protein|nr:patatin-like phospholipase family protein [Gammaproteobacteria bacterium]